MSKTTTAAGTEDNFQSTDSLDRLLNMAGPSIPMDIDTRLDAQRLEDYLNRDQENEQHGTPYVKIIEQPKQKELRFRYECEGRSAGSLPGEKADLDRKTFPTIKIHNYNKPVKVVASLVSREKSPRPHPHGLVGKDCELGVCAVTVQPTEKMHISFPNLGIQCVKQKEVISALKQKRRMRIDPFNWFATNNLDLDKCKPKMLEFEMNVVCICFQVFIEDPNKPNSFTVPLPPVVTHPIFDKKGATLHIARCDRYHGSVKGGDELFILCDKVQRDDIAVVFYSEEQKWEALAEFSPSDIHRQVAIVCKIPKYADQKIDRPVKVKFLLRRPSDSEQSDPLDFTYVPHDPDDSQVGAKRKRKTANFTDYFTGPVDTSIKVENFDAGQSSCSYASPHVPPEASQTCNVKQKLREKLQATKSDSYLRNVDVRVPPQGEMSTPQTTTRSRSYKTPKRSSKIAAQFNVSNPTNFGTVTSLPQAEVKTELEELTTINPEFFRNATTDPIQAQIDPTQYTAEQLLNSLQEGFQIQTRTFDDADPLNEAELAVRQLLAGIPDFASQPIETVANPSGAIELLNAGHWQLDGSDLPASFTFPDDNTIQFTQNIGSGDIDGLDLTQLDYGGEMLMISDPNSPEMIVEGGVNDSVTIPYSNSVELGETAPVLDTNKSKN